MNEAGDEEKVKLEGGGLLDDLTFAEDEMIDQ